MQEMALSAGFAKGEGGSTLGGLLNSRPFEPASRRRVEIAEELGNEGGIAERTQIARERDYLLP